jgi:subtilase family protein
MGDQMIQPDYNLYLAGKTFVPPEAPFLPPWAHDLYFFVQFTESLTLEERDRIQRVHRLKFDRYVPNFAFLERLRFEKWEALSQEKLYRSTERYQPEYKISPQFSAEDFHTTEGSHPDGLLLRAVLFPETDDETLKRIIGVIISLRATFETSPDDQLGPSVIDNRELGGDLQIVFVLPSTERLLRIAEIEEVQWIEKVAEPHSDTLTQTRAGGIAETRPDGCPQPNMVAGTIQSGTPGATPVWQNGLDGRDQVIGILDENVADITHCMFRDGDGNPIGMSHRKIVGRRNPSGKIDDHATLVAGIAAGDQVSLPGKGANRGIAWAAKLSLDDLTGIKDNSETIMDVLARQAKEGATIHSNSWNDNDESYNATAKAADTFVRLNEENLVCGSAANRNEKLGSPGMAKNVLCVCAGGEHSQVNSTHLKHCDGRSGPTIDLRRKPDICAPGRGIHSALIESKCGCTTTNCATSWSTPVIAGAAALVRQYYLEGFHHAGVKNAAKSHRPSAALIKATLLNSTVLMEDAKEYPNGRTGWGLAKLDNALFFAGGPRNLFFEDVRNVNGLETGHSRSHTISVKSTGQPLKITLVWTDPTAEPFAGKALVNDLDLVVTSHSGVTYCGNANFKDGFSQPQTNPPDDPNNVEMVIIKVPALGQWTLTVRARAANIGRQGYALVATGSLG